MGKVIDVGDCAFGIVCLSEEVLGGEVMVDGLLQACREFEVNCIRIAQTGQLLWTLCHVDSIQESFFGLSRFADGLQAKTV